MTEEQEQEFYREMHAKAVEATREAYASRSSPVAATSQHSTLALINAVVAPELARLVRANKQQDERLAAIETRLASIEARLAVLETPAPSVPAQACFKPRVA